MTESGNWTHTIVGFLESDVISWTENIWSEKKKGRGRKAKPKLLGKQKVTAQIEAVKDDLLTLKVMEAVVTEQAQLRPLKTYVVGSMIKKKSATIEKGEPSRLLWQDEDTRAEIIASKK